MLPIRFKTETILKICTSPPFLLLVTFSIAIIDREPLRGSSWGWGGGGGGGSVREREEFGCHDKINLIPYKAL